MDPAHIALFAAALPAAAAAAILLVLARLRRDRNSANGAGVAVVFGFAAGWTGIVGPPGLVPAETWKWLPVIAIAAGFVAELERFLAARAAWASWPLRAALAVGAAWACLFQKSPLAAAGYGAAILALIEGLDGFTARARRVEAFVAFAVLATGAALTVGISHWATGAQVGGALAAAVGGCLAVAWFRPVAPRTAVPVVGAVIGALVLDGSLLADVPRASAALLAAAPAVGWAADALRGSRGSAGVASAVRVAAVTACVGAAVAWAVAQSSALGY